MNSQLPLGNRIAAPSEQSPSGGGTVFASITSFRTTAGDYYVGTHSMPACTVQRVYYHMAHSANASGVDITFQIRKNGVSVASGVVAGSSGAVAVNPGVSGVIECSDEIFTEGQRLGIFADTNSDNVSNAAYDFLIEFTPT